MKNATTIAAFVALTCVIPSIGLSQDTLDVSKFFGTVCITAFEVAPNERGKGVVYILLEERTAKIGSRFGWQAIDNAQKARADDRDYDGARGEVVDYQVKGNTVTFGVPAPEGDGNLKYQLTLTEKGLAGIIDRTGRRNRTGPATVTLTPMGCGRDKDRIGKPL